MRQQYGLSVECPPVGRAVVPLESSARRALDSEHCTNGALLNVAADMRKKMRCDGPLAIKYAKSHDTCSR
jgi:hypothetical protein